MAEITQPLIYFYKYKKINKEMLKNVEFKSIYMGDGLRYVISGYLGEQKVGKVLSLNESKFIHVLSSKEKYEYAEKLLNPLTEARRDRVKLYDVIWSQGDVKHHQRIKAIDEKSAVERVHARGGSIISLQQV